MTNAVEVSGRAAHRLVPRGDRGEGARRGLAGKPLFADQGISHMVVGLWALAACGVLAWRLSRRES